MKLIKPVKQLMLSGAVMALTMLTSLAALLTLLT